MLRSTTFRSGNPAPRSTPDDAPHHRKTLKPYGNMKNYSAKEIKNIVLIGAPGTGKTTLAEAMAFEGKVIDRRGSIEANNTLSDNTDIEHEYKRSIYSTILFTEFMDRKLNIIDCPGSDDFCGSLFSAFKVGDVGVFLFNAQNGWEVGSEIQARYARLLKKPVIGVVNQLDAEKANFEATIESIRAASRVKPVIVQYPVNQGPEFNAFIDVLLMKMYRFKDNDGHREELEIPAEELEKAQELNKELVEMAAEHDEALMELYFDKGTLTQDDLSISINKLRDRVGMPPLDMAKANAKPDWYLSSEEYGYPNVTGANAGVILEIRRERTIELLQEGHRFEDLVRWKAGTCIDQAITGMYFPGPGEYDLTGDGKADLILYAKGSAKPSADEGVYVYELGTDIFLSEDTKGYMAFHKDVERTKFNEGRDYLYPIPSGERSLNKNLTQNPGWNDGLNF